MSLLDIDHAHLQIRRRLQRFPLRRNADEDLLI